MSRTFWIAAGLAVVLVVGAIAAFFLMRGGVQQGAGAYLPQLRECQDEIFAMAMHPADMAFEDRTVWHEVAGDRLEIGGVLSVLNEAGQRIGRAYDCTFEQGELQLANLR